MKEAFKETNFRVDRLNMVDHCNEIINRYQAQGLRLTLRQLYYQLVTRNIITNQEKSYKNLGNLVSEARLGGLVDWDSIEDRVRIPRKPNEFANLKSLVDAALYSYRLPRWDGQFYYVELWVEKDAISGVLSPMTTQYHITLMVNRGYSSQSAMYESAKRFISHTGSDMEAVLLYLGDHDPSGEDMVRDIRDRLEMFGATLEVKKIALTMGQVEQYNPPPNPAKLTDTRSPAYIEKHGDQSWEVDALPPDIMHQIVEDAILEYVDMDLMNTVKAKEELDKNRLRGFVSSIKD